jgi:iron(II)-dependent oxidoreductase
MGSTDSDRKAQADEKPQFRAHLKAYWIDKYEVTVTRYRKFCQETGHAMPNAPDWGWQDNHPIVSVGWRDAAAYAKWAGKRLPTEAEWEKAARGTDGRKYPWGDRWDASRCVNATNSPGGTQPVGRHPSGASPYGALDMAGNVEEWCADWYDKKAYQRYAKGNLKPPSSGTHRVLRGGSWLPDFNPTSFRCAYRFPFYPDLPDIIDGFRCVRGLP